MSHFNELTPAEDERLSILAEECAEVIQAICKIKRHGYTSYNPITDGPHNRTSLEKELGHVANAVRMMTEAGDIERGRIEMAANSKKIGIRQWLHHQPDSGEKA